MVVGCGPTCLKYTFFTFNFLVFLAGGAVLGIALWARFDDSLQSSIDKHFTDQGQQKPPELKQFHVALYVMMGIGGMLLLCGGLGCLGACCESPCLLGTFFAIILILFLAEVAAAIYIFVRKDQIKEDLSKWVKEHLVDKYNSDKVARETLEDIQKGWKCCGANGCADYAKQLTPPSSCGCTAGPLGSTKGCVDKLVENMKLVAIIAVCLVAIELLAMIFACILCSSIRRYSY